MKKIFLSAVILFSAIMAAQAQADSAATPTFDRSYAVKWNPASLVFGKIGLLGEYNYRKKRSITFGIGIPKEAKHSFKLDDSTREVTLKTTSVMAGYRMYLGKKSMSGFYFEPYLKYMKNEALTFVNIDVNGSNELFSLKSDYSGFGIGAQLGIQFRIAKVVNFDFFLIGPEANSAKHEMLAVNINPSVIPWTQVEEEDIENNLRDAVKDVPIIGKKIEFNADKNAHSVSSSYKGFLPGFRIGGTIGVRF